MVRLTRSLLSSKEKGPQVLSTIDGPIKAYMAELLENPATALSKISSDFQSVESPLYAKGQSKGFNLHRARFKSVVINTYFHVEDYLQHVSPDSEEYAILADVLSAIVQIWFHPLRSTIDKTGLHHAYSRLLTWLDLETFTGNPTQAQNMLLSAYLLAYVGHLNMTTQSGFIKTLIPAEIDKNTQALKEKISTRYAELPITAPTPFVADDVIEIQQHYIENINQWYQALKSKSTRLQSIYTEHEPFINLAIELLSNNENEPHALWSYFDDYQLLKDFLAKLNLSKSETKHWQHKFKQLNKVRLNLKNVNPFFKKAKSYLTDDYINEQLNVCIKNHLSTVFVKGEFDFETDDLQSSLVTGKAGILHAIVTINDERIKQHYIDHLNSDSLEDWSLDITTGNYSKFIDQICTHQPLVFNQRKYEYLLAQEELDNNIKSIKKLQRHITTFVDQFEDFKAQIAIFCEEKTLMKLAQLFNETLQNFIKTAIPRWDDESQATYQETFETINQQLNRILDELQEAQQLIETFVDAEDEVTALALYENARKQQSENQTGFIAWILKYLSPSYSQCLSICSYFIDSFLSLSPQNGIASAQSYQDDLNNTCTEFHWWDIASTQSQTFVDTTRQFQFFKVVQDTKVESNSLGLQPSASF